MLTILNTAFGIILLLSPDDINGGDEISFYAEFQNVQVKLMAKIALCLTWLTHLGKLFVYNNSSYQAQKAFWAASIALIAFENVANVTIGILRLILPCFSLFCYRLELTSGSRLFQGPSVFLIQPWNDPALAEIEAVAPPGSDLQYTAKRSPVELIGKVNGLGFDGDFRIQQLSAIESLSLTRSQHKRVRALSRFSENFVRVIASLFTLLFIILFGFEVQRGRESRDGRSFDALNSAAHGIILVAGIAATCSVILSAFFYIR